MGRLGAMIEDRWVWCLALIVAVAAVPRIWALGSEDLWFDEAFSALVAIAPQGGVVAEMTRDSSPPLYFMLLAGWERVFGPGPAALRSLSVLCGLVSVGLCGLLGRALWDRRVGLGAAFLLAFSPLHILYSRETRPYSLMVLWVVATLLALEWWRRSPQALPPALVACCCVAASLYTHNYGIFLLAVLAAWGPLAGIPARRAAICAASIALLYLPWVPVVLAQLGHGATTWLASLWAQTPPELALAKSLGAFTIGGATPPWVPLGDEYLPFEVHLAAYAVFALAAISALSQARARSDAVVRVAVALAALLVLPHLVSLLVVPILLVGRHDVMALPPFLLLAAYGLDRLRPTYRALAWSVVAFLSIASLAALWVRPTTHQGREQAELLAAHAAPSDEVLCTGYTRNTLEYYSLYLGSRLTFRSFPSSMAKHRGWVDTEESDDPSRVLQDAESVVAALRESVRGSSTLWIAHAPELRQANGVLLALVGRTFEPAPCPGSGDTLGFSCWRASRRTQ